MTVSSRREQTPVSTERDLNENVKEFRNSDKFDNNSSDTDYSDSDSKMSADEREARLQPDPSASSSSSGDEAEAPIVDPFTHRLGLGPVDWIKTIWCTFFLMPIRIFFLFLSVIGAYVCSFFALRGLSDEQKSRYPLTGYRKVFRSASSFFGRVAFRVTGFLSVNVKGVQASAEEAPILVVAPHSTFFDGFAAFFSGLPYIVSRKENKAIPFIGKCIECAQALCVSREDPKSRQKTVQEIIRRIGSGDPWPQLMIFPEGSCSNRQALMSFKPGAFYPGKAVQPVLIRYPNKLDTVTWTWNQTHGALTVLWLTLTQPFSRAELEFLPIYHPSPEEVADPKLFASNVRDVMAAALGVPTSDVTFEDVKAMYGKRSKKKD